MKKVTVFITAIALISLMACKSEKKDVKEIESSSIEKELDKALEEEMINQDSNSTIDSTEETLSN